MSDKMKKCRFGNKCESKRLGIHPSAPLMPETTEYFRQKRNGSYHNQCIACHTHQLKNPKGGLTTSKIGEIGRTAVIEQLHDAGIPAVRSGKVDILAGGILRIEVKTTTPAKRFDGWMLNFNSQKDNGGIRGDLVAAVLLDKHCLKQSISYFPPTFPSFYRKDTGELKYGAQILRQPSVRKGNNSPLTMDMIHAHEDDIGFVRETIEILCSHLRNRTLKLYRQELVASIAPQMTDTGPQLLLFKDAI